MTGLPVTVAVLWLLLEPTSVSDSPEVEVALLLMPSAPGPRATSLPAPPPGSVSFSRLCAAVPFRGGGRVSAGQVIARLNGGEGGTVCLDVGVLIPFVAVVTGVGAGVVAGGGAGVTAVDTKKGTRLNIDKGGLVNYQKNKRVASPFLPHFLFRARALHGSLFFPGILLFPLFMTRQKAYCLCIIVHGLLVLAKALVGTGTS